jgi:Tol biopolymer transport system component
LKRFVAVIACLLLITKTAFAIDPGLDWKTIESEHLYVHYADGNKALAEHVLSIAEAAHKRLTRELNWQPLEKTHVVLSDETDQSNGYATPIFFNRTVLFLTPPSSVNTLEDFDDWFDTLVFHEYTHIVHLDKSAGSPEYLRNIFGRFLLLFPNLLQPAWVLEGLATHKETYPDRGVGRGQSTMFASMMREEVANGLQPISHVNLPVSTWPAGTTRYLYGVYFMEFIAERYGEDKLQQWVEEYSDNLFPFLVNTTANKALGKNLTPLWADFEQWLIDRFQPQIDDIKATGIKGGVQVSEGAYRSDSVRVVASDDGEEVYYVLNDGYQHSQLMHIDTTGRHEVLAELDSPADLDIHPEAGLLLTRNEFCNNYSLYKDIYYYDAADQELQRLTECGRYLYVSWHPDGKQVFAVHHEASRFSLQRLRFELSPAGSGSQHEQASLKQQDILWQAKDGEIIGQIDVSLDGKSIVASVWRRGCGWNLELFDIASRQWHKLTSSVSIEANPQFTADGNILFTMEVDGVYNLQRYYMGSGRIVQLTNLIGGAFQSSQANKDSPIYYAGYTAEGYAIFKLDDVSGIGVTTDFGEPQLAMIDYPAGDHEQRDYSALSNMYPRWWFPTLGVSEQRTEIGITTSGNDALGIHQYSINLSYDTKLDAAAGSLLYAYADRFYANAQRLNDITLDANGDLLSVADRNIVSAIVAFPDYYVRRQYNLLFSAIHDKTGDSGLVGSDGFEDNLLGVAGLYNSAEINPLSISKNDGMSLRLVAEDSDLLHSDYSGQIYTLDWRQYIRTGRESVFALRFVQGWGTDNPQPFKLGGEGFNQNVLNAVLGNGGQPVFDVRDYALRGYKEGLPQLRGRRMQLLTGEWRFPIQRTERGFMAPPVGLMQWFGNVFAEVGSAYRSSPETYYSSAGFELNADINVFYNVTLRTRLGYGHGFDDEIGDDRVYVKLGGSF